MYRATNGILRAMPRVGVDQGWDETDGTQLFASTNASGQAFVCTTSAAGGYCNDHLCGTEWPNGTVSPVRYPACAQKKGFGWTGTMYPSMLRLHDGRVLLTFTQRCDGLGRMSNARFGRNGSAACHNGNLTDGYGTGMRALVSDTDGANWDFDRDYMVLSAQDDTVNPVINGKTTPNGPGSTSCIQPVQHRNTCRNGRSPACT